ncbi:MAG: TrbI/VirB10 family protein [Synergistaceae bacterium]|jgi:type IV secretion system protein VirB10|nr:TrbI/VirB10 family protein [Synergistaceae bacterium]
MRNEQEKGEQNGPNVGQSGKKTKHYGKRVIFAFLAFVAIVLFCIATQADFSKPGYSRSETGRDYRAPQPSGFAELAAGMRRDRKTPEPSPVPVPETKIQKILIEGERRPPIQEHFSAIPRFYSDKNDAQAASTLRTLKLQALTAKPVVDDFKTESGADAANGGGKGAVSSNNPGMNGSPSVMDSANLAALLQQGQTPDANGQAQKQDFLRGSKGGGSLTPQGYSDSLPVPQQFPYELKAGTLIPGILISGINSDLPGNVISQVSENVWDTATGKHVLIPKGTRILGVYDSQVTFGQRRVLLVWNRLIFPNGTTLDIAGSPGIDQAGYSGLSGRVNEHWGTMLKSALLASVFVAGAEIVYDSDSSGNSENKSPRDVAAESAAGSIIDMGAKIMNKAADIQPTITIRPGKKMGIFVQQDVVFPFPYF